MDIMQQIRHEIKTEEFDYLLLLECLSSYKRPRDKITKLLKSKSIIRVKKGIYIFGNKYRLRPFSTELLSNLIYGPSYVSFEYALQYYGLIPESVTKLTCASYKKSKLFETPIGDFVYKTVTKKTFPIGITRKNINDETSFLIALKEKALTDYLTHLKPFSTQEDLMQYLVEGMRIEKTNILSLDFKIIEEISEDSRNPNINLLWKILKK